MQHTLKKKKGKKTLKNLPTKFAFQVDLILFNIHLLPEKAMKLLIVP